MPCAAEVIEPQLVVHDKENVHFRAPVFRFI
jgi:hypothetical protein